MSVSDDDGYMDEELRRQLDEDLAGRIARWKATGVFECEYCGTDMAEGPPVLLHVDCAEAMHGPATPSGAERHRMMLLAGNPLVPRVLVEETDMQRALLNGAAHVAMWDGIRQSILKTAERERYVAWWEAELAKLAKAPAKRPKRCDR